MSLDSIHSGWNATDDGEAVPVRSAVPKTEGPRHAQADIVHPMADFHEVVGAHAAAADPKLMHLSAVTGIGAVLVCAAFYFGFLNLKGSLTGDLTATNSQTVTITTAGEFSPTSITVHPGDSVIFKNEDADPQVLKSKDGREVFPVQVLFADPFTATVPADAAGTYTYFSETLPEDKTLTITVVAAETAASVSSSAPATEAQNIEIPLPFAGTPGGQPQTVSVAVESSSSSSAASVSYSNGKGESTVISLGNGGSSSVAAVKFDPSKLPTNPYTVEAGKNSSSSSAIVEEAKATQTLHSGAPLAQMKKHMPKAITQTGPADTLALLSVAFALFLLTYRRALQGLAL